MSAAILLSLGDLDRLRYFANVAQTDPRDLISWAEHPPGVNEPKTYEELHVRMRKGSANMPVVTTPEAIDLIVRLPEVAGSPDALRTLFEEHDSNLDGPPLG